MRDIGRCDIALANGEIWPIAGLGAASPVNQCDTRFGSIFALQARGRWLAHFEADLRDS